MTRRLGFSVLIFSAFLPFSLSPFLPPAEGALLDHGLRVEGERMLQPGAWRLSGYYGIESNINPGTEIIIGQDVELDVQRLPLSLRYGYSPKVEFGVDMMFEQNKGLDIGVVQIFNKSGIAYIDLVAKHKFLPWSTFIGRVGILNDDQLYTAGRNVEFALDVLLTLPLNLPIGMPNLIHFNAGMRMKSGHPDIDADNRADARGFTDPIHLGWSLVVSPWARWSLVGEVFVRRSPFDLEEEAEMSVGGRFAYTERSVLHLSLVHGFSGGSPDWGFRFGYETSFGTLTERRIARAEPPSDRPREFKTEEPPPLELSVTRLTTIAEAAYARGDYVGAADAFSQLVSRLPSDGRIYFNLGVCHYNLKNYKLAEGEFLKAMTLQPNDAEIHLYIGHCQFMQNRSKEAKLHWEEALRLDPANDMARFLLSSLQ
ncbi:tetratricopeptide repeat protein [bacterium]|nr:tetratricopeptide repeat protein [bacterium]